MNLDISAMIGKPMPYFLILVVRSIVLNQIDFLGKVASHQSLQIGDISRSIEDLLKMVKETGRIEFDRAKDF